MQAFLAKKAKEFLHKKGTIATNIRFVEGYDDPQLIWINEKNERTGKSSRQRCIVIFRGWAEKLVHEELEQIFGTE